MNNVLLVEDDPLTAEIYQHNLAAAGFAVERAADGPKAIERLSAQTPDLVLLDLMLGESNGVDVLRYVRSHPDTRTLPVIVLSNVFTKVDVRAAWKAGANDYLNKSDCSPERLVDVVRMMLTLAAPRNADTPRTTSHALPNAPAQPEPFFSPGQWHRSLDSAIRREGARLGAAARAWRKAPRETMGEAFTELYHAVHHLCDHASAAKLPRTARLAGALEALAHEMRVEVEMVDVSSRRTVHQAIDLLPRLLAADIETGAELVPAPLALVVDDDPVACEISTVALERTGIATFNLVEPELAAVVGDRRQFDLILLDIEMPGIDGFRLCEQLHNTPLNVRTPVVFITARADAATREQFLMSGASDFICKPVRMNELAVKALMHIARSQLDPRN